MDAKANATKLELDEEYRRDLSMKGTCVHFLREFGLTSTITQAKRLCTGDAPSFGGCCFSSSIFSVSSHHFSRTPSKWVTMSLQWEHTGTGRDRQTNRQNSMRTCEHTENTTGTRMKILSPCTCSTFHQGVTCHVLEPAMPQHRSGELQ